MSIDSIQSVVGFVTTSSQPDLAIERSKGPDPAPEKAPPSVSPPAPLPEARTLEVNASFGDGHIVIYRILDKQTGQLVEQIPPEQFLEAARSAQEVPVQPSEQKLNLKL